MPKLSAVVTGTTTQVVTLEPKLKKQLLTRLTAYAALKGQIDLLKEEMDAEKALIGKLRAKTGEQSIQVDGYTITEVRGVKNTLDRKKLVSLGCALAWLDEATITSPKKPYELVTLPGERSRHDSD